MLLAANLNNDGELVLLIFVFGVFIGWLLTFMWAKSRVPTATIVPEGNNGTNRANETCYDNELPGDEWKRGTIYEKNGIDIYSEDND